MRQFPFFVIGIAIVSLMVSCVEMASTNTPSPTSNGDYVPADTASGEVIEYRRNGGFPGFDDHLIITTDKAILTRKSTRHEFQLRSELLAPILKQLDLIQFSQLKPEYLPTNTCCDLIEYIVTYKGYSVRTMDTAVPSSLQPVLNTLNEIIQTGTKP